MSKKRPGISYKKRVADANRIYDQYAKQGVPNREIWLRYIYPVYGVSERTFYNLLKAPTRPEFIDDKRQLSLFDPIDEQ